MTLAYTVAPWDRQILPIFLEEESPKTKSDSENTCARNALTARVTGALRGVEWLPFCEPQESTFL